MSSRRNWLVLAALLAAAALVLALLRWRGFKATSTPTRFEAHIARSLRNFAIPAREANRSNPFSRDEHARAAGQQYFFSHCALCHGVDGRGGTAIGGNEYPRVPDLHGAPTQHLTDGELHYLIENGVQLSGMPALPGPPAATDRTGWQLVTFLRGLTSTPPPAAALVSAHYVGSAACRSCHADIYDRWQKTPMANVVRDPKQYPHAVIPDLATNTVAPFALSQVALVYGSRWKQRYFTRIGDDYYPLPAQWDIGTHQWLPYHVPDKGADWWAASYPSANLQRPTGPTCDGCHSVAYDIQTHRPAEWNVGCERCHGPGSDHAAHPTPNNILNPASLDDVASDDTCIQCHSQGRPRTPVINGRAYDWPVGYQVGLRLVDFWSLDSSSYGQSDFLYFSDGTAHKNRMQGNDFVQSLMYRRGVTCATCHDVHGTDNIAQLRLPPQQLCLSCHGPNSPNGPHAATIADHTHHADGSPGSQCIACHMPKIETQGVPGAFVSAHTFRFIPPAWTDKYKIPNPCTTCHAGQSTAWANQALLHWSASSPWRVVQ
ncbi:MAG TPA: cytochrome c3 family protein [Terriglobales bacterium]|nr:cytochrome c3 family protein [Terriglobales bacterium]